MNAQELQLELMKLASFNSFNGEKVVKSLLKHKDLWKSALMDGVAYSKGGQGFEACINLIKLRDLPDYWNVDTLFILPVPGKEDELEALAKTWKADEVDYIGGKQACDFLGAWSQEGTNNKKTILRVWWD